MVDFFKEIKPRHSHIYPAKMTEMGLSRHFQIPMFDYNMQAHVRMGVFFEMVSACLFGGVLVDSVVSEKKGIYIGCKPDVKNGKDKRFIESKAVRMGNQLNLLHGQVSAYKALQIVYPGFDIYYCIWRHSVKGIKSYSGSHMDLNKELAEKTRAGILVPFSLIERMCFEEGNELARYVDNKAWPDCTRIKSTILNSILFKPSETLEKYGGDYKYTYKRYRTPRLKVDGVFVESFPIIVVENKNDNWKDNLLNTVPF